MNYNKNFKEAIEQITSQDFDIGIKLMNFQKRYKMAESTKCICKHDVSKYYSWTYNDKEYKIGCICVKKHKGTFSQDQIDIIEDIDKKFKYESKKIKKQLKEESIFLSEIVKMNKVSYTMENLFKKKDIQKLKWIYYNYKPFKDKDDIFDRLNEKYNIYL